MNICLIVFGNKPWENALNRVSNQAKSLEIFSNIYRVDSEVLNNDTTFLKEHLDFVNTGVRGYGAWIWKTYILESAFKKFPDSDFFMYLDSGSEFNINNKTKKRFFEYFEIADSKTVFGFRGRDVEAILGHCTVINNIYPEAKYTNQFEANTLIFKNNKNSLDIIKTWEQKNIENNYYNVNPSKEKCCDIFAIHLEDQPVLSCILKKEGIEGIPDEGSWYMPSKSVYDTVEENIDMYPIFTARNPFKGLMIGKCLKYTSHVICIHSKDGSNCPSLIYIR
jgi:hypothetical protein